MHSLYSRYFAHSTAVIDDDCLIGDDVKIWHFTHVSSHAKIGKGSSLGQNVFVATGVSVGNNCKIQNNVSLYEGVILEDDVFCGPSCVFTNVNNPRSNVDRRSEFQSTIVRQGATIGANATIICGKEIGAYSFIAAGAVVTKSVKPHALMVGVPARQVGWVSHANEILGDDLVCPRTKQCYKVAADGMLEVSF